MDKEKEQPITLYAPADCSVARFNVEGVEYVVADGKVTPPILRSLIPDSLWGYGFTAQAPEEAKAEEKKPSGMFSRG